MGRVILVGASAAVLAVVVVMAGCGGDTTSSGTHTTAAGGASGSSGAVGASGASGAVGASGSSGRVGAGGVTSGAGGGGSGGTGGSTSPGKASISFTTAPSVSYCMTGCGGPVIGIKDAAGNALELVTTCTDVGCASCSQSGCPNFYCPPMGVAVTSAKMDWDGTIYVTSTCGAGTSCMDHRYAKPGKYTATFCATPGKLSEPDGGIRQCVPSGPAQCGQVEFDFPSATVAMGTVGP